MRPCRAPYETVYYHYQPHLPKDKRRIDAVGRVATRTVDRKEIATMTKLMTSGVVVAVAY